MVHNDHPDPGGVTVPLSGGSPPTPFAIAAPASRLRTPGSAATGGSEHPGTTEVGGFGGGRESRAATGGSEQAGVGARSASDDAERVRCGAGWRV